MKKLIYLIVIMLVLGLIVSGCSLLVPTVEKDETVILTKAPKVKPPSGAHYNLNIIGKKSDWNGGGSYDNESRHTMFVPENTDEFKLNGTQCYAPAPLPDGAEDPVGPGITIWMTSCDNKIDRDGCDFAVLDGNAFDDCKCEFQLAPGKYEVWIVAKAKPAKKDEPEYYTDITGWVYAKDEFGGTYYFDVGFVKVTKSKKWKDATDLFYVSPGEDYFGIISEDMWVFEYLSFLTVYDFGEDPDITDAAYCW